MPGTSVAIGTQKQKITFKCSTADHSPLLISGDVPELVDAIVQKQSLLNRSTSGQWHLYSSHRRRVERLLVPSDSGKRICVLGAGNCNDLDLNWLTKVYRQVQLVDIDADALSRAAKFQKVDDCDKLQLRGAIDITGLADQLSKWKISLPKPDEIQKCLRLAASSPTQLAEQLGGPFDVVLSPCVLSQLLMPLHDTIGGNHPAFLPMLSAIRARHFRLMVDLLSPGGRGVFVCDLLSSIALPNLAQVPEDQLPGVLQNMQALGKTFAGLEPTAIRNLLTRDPILASRIVKIELGAPWLWHLGLSKCYAVYGMTFEKRNNRSENVFVGSALADADELRQLLDCPDQTIAHQLRPPRRTLPRP
jgi:hypothetical protein